MEPGGNDTRWNLQLQLGQEPMERLADRPRMDAAPFCEREQRRLGLALLAVTLSYVTSDSIGQLGSERHDSTLVELGFADDTVLLRETQFNHRRIVPASLRAALCG